MKNLKLPALGLIVVCLAAELMLTQLAAGEDKTNPDRPRATLHHGDVPLGSLGYPLGDLMTIEGTRAKGLKINPQTLFVDTVNGKKLEKPVAISIDNVRELPADVRIVLKGYESGRMLGPVPAAIQVAEEKGEKVMMPQRSWHWDAFFVALTSVQPKLELHDEQPGFKTERQMKLEEEKGK